MKVCFYGEISKEFKVRKSLGYFKNRKVVDLVGVERVGGRVVELRMEI